MGSRGPKWTITDEAIETIGKALMTGATITGAVGYANVNYQTYCHWIRKAEELKTELEQEESTRTEDDLLDHEVQLLNLLNTVTRARAQFQILAMTAIRKAGLEGQTYTTVEKIKVPVTVTETDFDGKTRTKVVIKEELQVVEVTQPPDVRHLEWALERSYWQDYGRRNAIEISGNEEKPLQVNMGVQPVASLENYRALKQAMIEAELPLPDMEVIDAEIIEAEEA